MSHWYEVFDNEEVQWRARKQAARLSAFVATAVLLTLLIAALGLEGMLAPPLVGGLLFVIWLGVVRWVARQMRRLRRVVWCVKLSEERVVGYDYTRSKALLTWDQIRRVDLHDDGLVLVGAAACSFEIPHLFPDFAELSHRIVYYAEGHGVPVYVGGQPWQELDVCQLFPFLADDPSADAPGAPAA